MEGSSRMYMTPVSPLPICVESRMRCASPPLNVDAERSSVRYSRPTFLRKWSRAFISFNICAEIWASLSVSFSVSKNEIVSVTENIVRSHLLLPPTVTHSASGRSFFPWQVLHSRCAMYFSRLSRILSPHASAYRRRMSANTPIHGRLYVLCPSPLCFWYTQWIVSSPVPSMRMLCCFLVSLLNGVSRLNLYCFASASNIELFQALSGLYGASAPSLNERFSSGTINSLSNSIFSPSPVQSGQAPYGLLNENRRGCSSGIEMPQSGQEFFCEKNTSCSM